jgi:hypothetical protein
MDAWICSRQAGSYGRNEIGLKKFLEDIHILFSSLIIISFIKLRTVIRDGYTWEDKNCIQILAKKRLFRYLGLVRKIILK